MTNKEVIKDLTQEQVEQIAGGEGEIVSNYLNVAAEDTKGGDIEK